MSPYAKLIIDMCDEKMSVDINLLRHAAWRAGLEARVAKLMCCWLGVSIRGE